MIRTAQQLRQLENFLQQAFQAVSSADQAQATSLQQILCRQHILTQLQEVRPSTSAHAHGRHLAGSICVCRQSLHEPSGQALLTSVRRARSNCLCLMPASLQQSPCSTSPRCCRRDAPPLGPHIIVHWQGQCQSCLPSCSHLCSSLRVAHPHVAAGEVAHSGTAARELHLSWLVDVGNGQLRCCSRLRLCQHFCSSTHVAHSYAAAADLCHLLRPLNSVNRQFFL